MKFGFKNMLGLGFLAALMGHSAQTSAEEITAIRKINSGGSSFSIKPEYPSSHRSDAGKKRKSNRKRLSQNAKLKRRRAK